jgi:hypothetical protein
MKTENDVGNSAKGIVEKGQLVKILPPSKMQGRRAIVHTHLTGKIWILDVQGLPYKFRSTEFKVLNAEAGRTEFTKFGQESCCEGGADV